MYLTNKNKIIYGVTAIIFLVGGYLCLGYLRANAPTGDTIVTAKAGSTKEFKTVKVGNTAIRAELASNDAERIQGLSDRASLATSTGMLFVFDWASDWGIWMKDMNFPIDVLWITDDMKINFMVEGMTPESYPEVYKPNAAARYVLEVPAGTVKKAEIKLGQSVIFE